MNPLHELMAGAAAAMHLGAPCAMRWTPPPADWCTACGMPAGSAAHEYRHVDPNQEDKMRATPTEGDPR